MHLKLHRLVLGFGLALLGMGPLSAQSVININLTGNIDGLSDILISPSGFQWEHFQAEAPGLQGGVFPTNITVTRDSSVVLNTSWFPDWTPPTVLAGGDPPIYSSLLSTGVDDLQQYIPSSESLLVLQSRAGTNLLETPTAGNGNTFRIEFNDISIPGSADYQISLTYSTVPEPGTYAAIFGAVAVMLAFLRPRSCKRNL